MIMRSIERILFASRWLLLPFLVGLVVGLVMLLLRFMKEEWELAHLVWSGSNKEILAGLLSLVEVVLIVALVLIVIFSSYENFVSKVRPEDHPRWPAWMAHIDFTQLKHKLIATVTTIASIELLKEIASIDDVADRYLGWLIAIQLTFATTAVLLSLSDRLASNGKHDHPPPPPPA
jgi:uncharacterized protein (TIGR00645 family)